MKPLLGASLAILLVTAGQSRADDKDPNAILDKAIKAVGGEEKLKKLDAWTTKSKGDDHLQRRQTTRSPSNRPSRGSITTNRRSKASSAATPSRA